MSALEFRPVTRGNRMAASAKHRGSDCHDALNRYREKERWGYNPTRPLERFDIHTAYDHLDAIEEPDDDTGIAYAPDMLFSNVAKAHEPVFIGRMVNGCFICR